MESGKDMTALIELKNISCRYEEVTALQNISFVIEEGESIGLAGDNGSGKTTLLRLLCGLAFAYEGTYLFAGREVNEQTMKDPQKAKALHSRIGYVFQNPENQLFCASVREEIAFGPHQMGLSEEEVDRRTEDVMKMLGIQALADRAPYHLSGGEQKKTALACVLSMNPAVLIIDEPLNGLDRRTREWMRDFMLAWKKAGRTLLIATHDETLLEDVPDRILTIGENHTIVSDERKVNA
jgi:cobalt/nickel transport system ATP-binding protein